ncbi:MAG: hypothetical protein KDB82_01090 [Planctomycetes bacterium]|nr:hypothetical protein [Planctomycetota bacterium]
MAEEVIEKPMSPVLRVIRVVWAVLLVSILLFSIVMAVWGDMRQALMLKFLDARYVKSFTLQVPEGTQVWLGGVYLGKSERHPLGEDEPDDYPDEVEGMKVVLPRVYFYEQQLMENSVECAPGDSSAELIKRLAPKEELLWVQTEALGEDPTFVPALLKDEDGKFDFVNLGRVDWPEHDGSTKRFAFLLRMVLDDKRHVFGLEHTELWTDQLYAEEGHFWAKREQWDDYPPRLSGQTKTVWRFFVNIEEDDAAWLQPRCPGDYDRASWYRPPAKE